MFLGTVSGLQQTTSYKVVLPFYFYAAFSLLLGCMVLFVQSDIGLEHYFTPVTLSLTHIMALGWGTMIILGASHQLLPVLIEGKLYSTILAYISFVFASLGIPLLVYGFYTFNFGIWTQIAAVFINIAAFSFLVNVLMSILKNKKANIHAWFMSTATIWLCTTTFFGLLLVFNFSYSILPADSVKYLSLHAHFGIMGWFLMMVFGVGSRLVPMFLISKYNNNKTLQWIYLLINASLFLFIFFKIFHIGKLGYFLPIIFAFSAVLLFGNYCRNAYLVRIRKNVDFQMKTSLISVVQMFVPIVVLAFLLIFSSENNQSTLGFLYGFCIFFGWITAIIFGMTFKTLPFIVWNKIYHKKAHAGKTPAPKELFSEKVYYTMLLFYSFGFLIFIFGTIVQKVFLLKFGALFLLLAATLYVFNVMTVFLHKPQQS
jgi:hypothetical protein